MRTLKPMVTNGMPLDLVQVTAWEQYSWLRHGFSTRSGGTSTVYGPGQLNLGFTTDDEPERVRENRRRFVEAVTGGESGSLITVRQVHGAQIQTRLGGEAAEASGIIQADGLISAAPRLWLGIQVADCVPVLIADTRLRIVAAFHAGWRGTAQGIVQQGIARMEQEFRSAPDDLIGAVGPCIGPCCYAVGEEVRSEFAGAFPYAADLFSTRDAAMHLNLAEANRRQMLDAGMAAERIALVGECTGCTLLREGGRKYFSHRAENGFTGRSMALIGRVDEAGSRAPGSAESSVESA